MQTSLSATTERSDRDDLLSLKSDIQELINLTRESLQRVETIETVRPENGSEIESLSDGDDPLAKEYALFKVIFLL